MYDYNYVIKKYFSLNFVKCFFRNIKKGLKYEYMIQITLHHKISNVIEIKSPRRIEKLEGHVNWTCKLEQFVRIFCEQ